MAFTSRHSKFKVVGHAFNKLIAGTHKLTHFVPVYDKRLGNINYSGVTKADINNPTGNFVPKTIQDIENSVWGSAQPNILQQVMWNGGVFGGDGSYTPDTSSAKWVMATNYDPATGFPNTSNSLSHQALSSLFSFSIDTPISIPQGELIQTGLLANLFKINEVAINVSSALESKLAGGTEYQMVLPGEAGTFKFNKFLLFITEVANPNNVYLFGAMYFNTNLNKKYSPSMGTNVPDLKFKFKKVYTTSATSLEDSTNDADNYIIMSELSNGFESQLGNINIATDSLLANGLVKRYLGTSNDRNFNASFSNYSMIAYQDGSAKAMAWLRGDSTNLTEIMGVGTQIYKTANDTPTLRFHPVKLTTSGINSTSSLLQANYVFQSGGDNNSFAYPFGDSYGNLLFDISGRNGSNTTYLNNLSYSFLIGQDASVTNSTKLVGMVHGNYGQLIDESNELLLNVSNAKIRGVGNGIIVGRNINIEMNSGSIPDQAILARGLCSVVDNNGLYLRTYETFVSDFVGNGIIRANSIWQSKLSTYDFASNLSSIHQSDINARNSSMIMNYDDTVYLTDLKARYSSITKSLNQSNIVAYDSTLNKVDSSNVISASSVNGDYNSSNIINEIFAANANSAKISLRYNVDTLAGRSGVRATAQDSDSEHINRFVFASMETPFKPNDTSKLRLAGSLAFTNIAISDLDATNTYTTMYNTMVNDGVGNSTQRALVQKLINELFQARTLTIKYVTTGSDKKLNLYTDAPRNLESEASYAKLPANVMVGFGVFEIASSSGGTAVLTQADIDEINSYTGLGLTIGNQSSPVLHKALVAYTDKLYVDKFKNSPAYQQRSSAAMVKIKIDGNNKVDVHVPVVANGEHTVTVIRGDNVSLDQYVDISLVGYNTHVIATLQRFDGGAVVTTGDSTIANSDSYFNTKTYVLDKRNDWNLLALNYDEVSNPLNNAVADNTTYMVTKEILMWNLPELPTSSATAYNSGKLISQMAFKNGLQEEVDKVTKDQDVYRLNVYHTFTPIITNSDTISTAPGNVNYHHLMSDIINFDIDGSLSAALIHSGGTKSIARYFCGDQSLSVSGENLSAILPASNTVVYDSPNGSKTLTSTLAPISTKIQGFSGIVLANFIIRDSNGKRYSILAKVASIQTNITFEPFGGLAFDYVLRNAIAEGAVIEKWVTFFKVKSEVYDNMVWSVTKAKTNMNYKVMLAKISNLGFTGLSRVLDISRMDSSYIQLANKTSGIFNKSFVNKLEGSTVNISQSSLNNAFYSVVHANSSSIGQSKFANIQGESIHIPHNMTQGYIWNYKNVDNTYTAKTLFQKASLENAQIIGNNIYLNMFSLDWEVLTGDFASESAVQSFLSSRNVSRLHNVYIYGSNIRTNTGAYAFDSNGKEVGYDESYMLNSGKTSLGMKMADKLRKLNDVFVRGREITLYSSSGSIEEIGIFGNNIVVEGSYKYIFGRYNEWRSSQLAARFGEDFFVIANGMSSAHEGGGLNLEYNKEKMTRRYNLFSVTDKGIAKVRTLAKRNVAYRTNPSWSLWTDGIAFGNNNVHFIDNDTPLSSNPTADRFNNMSVLPTKFGPASTMAGDGSGSVENDNGWNSNKFIIHNKSVLVEYVVENMDDTDTGAPRFFQSAFIPSLLIQYNSHPVTGEVYECGDDKFYLSNPDSYFTDKTKYSNQIIDDNVITFGRYINVNFMDYYINGTALAAPAMQAINTTAYGYGRDIPIGKFVTNTPGTASGVNSEQGIKFLHNSRPYTNNLIRLKSMKFKLPGVYKIDISITAPIGIIGDYVIRKWVVGKDIVLKGELSGEEYYVNEYSNPTSAGLMASIGGIWSARTGIVIDSGTQFGCNLKRTVSIETTEFDEEVIISMSMVTSAETIMSKWSSALDQASDPTASSAKLLSLKEVYNNAMSPVHADKAGYTATFEYNPYKSDNTTSPTSYVATYEYVADYVERYESRMQRDAVLANSAYTSKVLFDGRWKMYHMTHPSKQSAGQVLTLKAGAIPAFKYMRHAVAAMLVDSTAVSKDYLHISYEGYVKESTAWNDYAGQNFTQVNGQRSYLSM